MISRKWTKKKKKKIVDFAPLLSHHTPRSLPASPPPSRKKKRRGPVRHGIKPTPQEESLSIHTTVTTYTQRTSAVSSPSYIHKFSTPNLPTITERILSDRPSLIPPRSPPSQAEVPRHLFVSPTPSWFRKLARLRRPRFALSFRLNLLT